MKKIFFGLLTMTLATSFAIGQTLMEGITHLYADRFKSAENTFQRMLAVNPNQIDAIYWLGQTYLDMDNNAAARQTYEKAMMTNGNAPLLLVGSGHVDLADGKLNEARQKFELAISTSRGKKGDDPVILNAIGRANVDAKQGDLPYAIEKLESAAQKDPKNPDIFLNLGNAYRKANPGQGGGQAYTNYQKALQINPQFSVAYIRIAKLFETQRNWDLVLQNLNDAVTRDPNFSLGFYELFYYYFFRGEYPQAENYFQKYIASRPNEDQVEHDYLQSQLCWARKDYDCAIAKAKAVEAAMGTRVKPRVLKQLSYSYLGKNDFTTAKRYVDEYFEKEKDGFVPADYLLKGEVYAGVGVPCAELYDVFLEGAAADTVLSTKIEYMDKAADYFKNKNCKKEEADMRMAIYNIRPNPNPAYFISYGILYAQANELEKADSLFNAYQAAFPDSIYGPYWRVRVNTMMDTTMSLEPYITNIVQNSERVLQIANTDKARFRSQAATVALTLAGYYNNVKKDRETALLYAQKGLEIDTANAQLKNIVEILGTKTPRPKTPARSGTNKPSASAVKPSGKNS